MSRWIRHTICHKISSGSLFARVAEKSNRRAGCNLSRQAAVSSSALRVPIASRAWTQFRATENVKTSTDIAKKGLLREKLSLVVSHIWLECLRLRSGLASPVRRNFISSLVVYDISHSCRVT